MAAGAVYRQSVVAALALAGAVLFIVAGLGAAARRVHVGGLDAQALAEKLAVPHPVSALDWPELRVRAVVPQPAMVTVRTITIWDLTAATPYSISGNVCH